MKRAVIFIITLVILQSGLVTAQDSANIITAEVVYPSLNIRVMPAIGARKIGQFAFGDVMTILQWETGYRGLWVRVTAPDKGLTGWVDAAYLYFSDESWRGQVQMLKMWDLQNPAYVENDSLPLPLTSYLSFCGGSWIKIWTEPTRTGTLIRRVDTGGMVTITANALINGTYSSMVRIYHHDTGTEGWVRAECVGSFYENVIDWRNDNLPKVRYDHVEWGGPIQVTEMPAVTKLSGYLRQSLGQYQPSLVYIPAGAEILLIGRNRYRWSGYSWFQVEYNGMVGWMYGGRINLPDGYENLPITSG